jgi:hypothetical protein
MIRRGEGMMTSKEPAAKEECRIGSEKRRNVRRRR